MVSVEGRRSPGRSLSQALRFPTALELCGRSWCPAARSGLRPAGLGLRVEDRPGKAAGGLIRDRGGRRLLIAAVAHEWDSLSEGVSRPVGSELREGLPPPLSGVGHHRALRGRV